MEVYLRGKNTLQMVGKLCKQKNAHLFFCGAIFQHARRNKIAKHRTAVERDNRSLYHLVFDTKGHWSQEVDDFLTMCSVSKPERTQVPASRLKYHYFATMLACTFWSRR